MSSLLIAVGSFQREWSLKKLSSEGNHVPALDSTPVSECSKVLTAAANSTIG